MITPWYVDIIAAGSGRLRAHREPAARGGRRLAQHGLARVLPSQRGVVLQRGRSARVADAPTASRCVAAERAAVPYLQSPASAHGRVERAFSFAARKVAAAAAAEADRLPARRGCASRAVLCPTSTSSSSRRPIICCEPRRWRPSTAGGPIDEIALLVAKRYGLQRSEARGAVERILLEMFEVDGAENGRRRRTGVTLRSSRRDGGMTNGAVATATRAGARARAPCRATSRRVPVARRARHVQLVLEHRARELRPPDALGIIEIDLRPAQLEHLGARRLVPFAAAPLARQRRERRPGT